MGEFGDFFGGNSVFRQKQATFVRVSVDCPPFLKKIYYYFVFKFLGGGGGGGGG